MDENKQNSQEQISSPKENLLHKIVKEKWFIPVVICTAVFLIVIFVLTQFVFVAGGMYSVHAKVLDLQGKTLTEDDFQNLSERIPNCDITWDVPFQGGALSSKTDTLTVTSLTEEDVHMLSYVTGLEKVHGEDCQDYLQLAQLQQNRPDVDVLYTVPIAGETYAKDTAKLTLTSLSQADAQRLPALLQLCKVEVSGCDDYAMLRQLQRDYPQWNLTYTVQVGDEAYPWDYSNLQVSNLSIQEISDALAGLPYLKTLDITNPLADHTELTALREQYSGVDMTWSVEMFGLTFDETVTEVDISGNIVESCEDIEKLVACLPNLEKLIMSDCGIDSETMAEFRERQRENYKVVWTVYLGNFCVLRTDDIAFMPYNQGEGYFYDDETAELKYCEDIICMDLGHQPITNIDFVKYMPHLKYLVLAHTRIRDASALISCQELIYLEIDWSKIQDYSPLVELKSLEDLNLSRTYCDITPILEMTWLKNLWIPNREEDDRQRLIEALPDTHLELDAVNTKGWRHLPNYYAQRDLLGMFYMNQ